MDSSNTLCFSYFLINKSQTKLLKSAEIHAENCSPGSLGSQSPSRPNDYFRHRKMWVNQQNPNQAAPQQAFDLELSTSSFHSGRMCPFKFSTPFNTHNLQLHHVFTFLALLLRNLPCFRHAGITK